MQAGRLNRYIDIEEKTVTKDGYGELIETWSKIATRRPASAIAVSGDEKFTASQFMGQRVMEFRVRWTAALSLLTTQNRIIYPATDSTPPDGQVFDVQDCREIGFREGLQIFAVGRQDVA